MFATIQKWGNSQGLRIPKPLLDAAGIRENDRVELIQSENIIQIKKSPMRKHRTLEERLTAFYEKSVDDIDSVDNEPETDWGKPEGREVW